MKKGLIVLLSILIVLLFTSCENSGKSDDVKTTTETKGFIESLRATNIAGTVLGNLSAVISSESSEINIDLKSCTNLKGDFVAKLYGRLYPSEKEIAVTKVGGSGTIVGSYTAVGKGEAQKFSGTFKDVVITFTYTVGEDSSSAEKSGTIKMGGSILMELDNSDALSYESTSLSINDTSYPDITSKGTHTMTDDRAGHYVGNFTLATIDGVEVDLDTLNKEKIEIYF